MNAECCLILETSTPKGSIALMMPNGKRLVKEFASDSSHNAILFGPLQELIDGLAGAKIDLVLVGSGPGSYSGTRVGIAAAQGVAMALGCPAVAVPSLLAVPVATGGKACLAIGDARRESYWFATMRDTQLVSDPELTDSISLAQTVESHITAGLTVFTFEDPTRFPFAPEVIDQIQWVFPHAKLLWQAWCATEKDIRAIWASQIPQPIYLKPPHITPAKRSSWVG